MSAITSKEALIARREAARAKQRARGRSRVVVNVSCGACGIASGAEQVLDVMQKTAAKQELAVDFFRSGCMTYCYAEPTVTITRPEHEPVTFGKVDENRARALVNKFIAKGEPVEGEIPAAFERVVL